MKTTILSIETSCDETAVSIVQFTKKEDHEIPSITILGNTLNSQVDTHRPFGGVYPTLAKREHVKNIVPLLQSAWQQAFGDTVHTYDIDPDLVQKAQNYLTREPDMSEPLIEFCKSVNPDLVDAIVVTRGPGLAPALWVGVNTARVLAEVWNKPLVGANHMEGHIVSFLYELSDQNIQFPMLAFLVSGGHTEFALAESFFSYRYLGGTRDDAVGEAFDKVARLLGLPYPGGPEISKKAALVRTQNRKKTIELPRPMMHSDSLDMSFSGLKTSVLYIVKKQKEIHGDILPEDIICEIACEFEEAVMDVLIVKARKALSESNAHSLALGGGVVANVYLRKRFEELAQERSIPLYLPTKDLSTDNAVMIAIAGYFQYIKNDTIDPEELTADGNAAISGK